MCPLALALAALLLPLSAMAATETVNGIEWTYTVSDGEAAVESGDYYGSRAVSSSTTGAITIPSTLGGYPVTSIGNYAFYNRANLSSVAIPDSVTSMGEYAFYGCSELTSVHISDLATWCGIDFGVWSNPLECAHHLFVNGSEVADLVVPDNVTKIGRAAFRKCNGLASVTIPDHVAEIGGWAFSDCTNLVSVSIGNGVTSIEECVFYGCNGLASMTISSGVMSIGDWAFEDCTRLKTTYLPSRFDGNTENLGISSGCTIYFYSGNMPPSPATEPTPPAILTYTIAFAANGGTGKMAAQTMTYGKAKTLTKNAFTRKDYVFLGWATSKSGAVKYKNAQSVKNLSVKGGTVTLYAKWAKKAYKVAFYANGGKGKMAVESMTYGKAKKLSANKFKRKGYSFKGWAKSKADAQKGKVAYANKKSVKNLVTNGKTVNLYAVWK